PAKPAASSPEPRFVYGGREDYRWQLSLAFVWFRFRSSVYNSNEFGVKTTVTYFLNEWLGVEGDLTAAFGAPVGNGGQDGKIAVYGGGRQVPWGPPPQRGCFPPPPPAPPAPPRQASVTPPPPSHPAHTEQPAPFPRRPHRRDT